MARAFQPSILCANTLLGGQAVWLAASGQWVSDIRLAHIENDEQQALQLLDEAGHDTRIAGAWLAVAEQDAAGKTQPLHFREKIRMHGPSFRGVEGYGLMQFASSVTTDTDAKTIIAKDYKVETHHVSV